MNIADELLERTKLWDIEGFELRMRKVEQEADKTPKPVQSGYTSQWYLGFLNDGIVEEPMEEPQVRRASSTESKAPTSEDVKKFLEDSELNE